MAARPHHANATPLATWLAVLAVVLACTAMWMAVAERDPVSAPSSDPADRHAELLQLRQRIQRLESELANVGSTPTHSVALRSEPIDYQRVERFVLELLDRTSAAKEPDRPESPIGRLPQHEALFAELVAAGRSDRADELWATVRSAGAIDEAVAYFEHLAAVAPESADAQTNLGIAYTEQMLASTDESTRIELGKRIDAQYDRALTVNPDHWEARFRRAVGQSYGPALSGGRQLAIENFERLVEQQANARPSSGFEQTYLFLGRMHAEQGNTERAKEVWRLGLQRHPGDAELRRLVER